jgi:hypothetical protein
MLEEFTTALTCLYCADALNSVAATFSPPMAATFSPHKEAEERFLTPAAVDRPETSEVGFARAGKLPRLEFGIEEVLYWGRPFSRKPLFLRGGCSILFSLNPYGESVPQFPCQGAGVELHDENE